MNDNGDKNALLYLLAGFGLGAIVGVAAGVLFAPKAGEETREELADKLKELKSKTEGWVAEQKAKKQAAVAQLTDELGA